MEQWQKSLAACITDPDELAGYFPCDPEPLRAIIDKYPMRITPYYLGLIHGVGDPVWRQCVPDPKELEGDGMIPDPLNEEALSPIPGIIHRYPDRVVLLATARCAVYCRFCMRKRCIGTSGIEAEKGYLDGAIRYVEKTSIIRDVILSGGDPLLLTDDELEGILTRLHRITHVEILRIGTRVPVTLPERITPACADC